MSERVYRLLRQVGLKPYEAKVLAVLLDGVPRTAGEISATTGVPQPRVYSVLDSLSAMGLVDIKLGKPKKYRVTDPLSSIERVVSSKMGELASLKSQIQEELKELRGSTFTTEPPDVWVIKNREEALTRIRRAIESANYEVATGLNLETFTALSGSLSALASESGGASLAITLYGDFLKSGFDSSLAKGNCEIRVRRIPITPLVIIDSSRAFILERTYILEITEEGLLRMLSDFYYHSVWRVGDIVKGFQPAPGRVVSFTDVWLAAGFVRRCMEESHTARVVVEGFSRQGVRGVLEGEVIDLIENGNGVQISLILNTAAGRVSVGGRGATLEEFEGRVFRITPL
ncbi:TrmB family transcriptional regulator [Infirmifilum sp. SLHALR2]|nr:MAG: hypothetical protein B7L53_07750 [Thermofilum sp. NZ13]